VSIEILEKYPYFYYVCLSYWLCNCLVDKSVPRIPAKAFKPDLYGCPGCKESDGYNTARLIVKENPFKKALLY